MSDSTGTGPFHVSVEADVTITNAARLGGGGRSDAELAQLLAGLIRRHAWEAGLEIPDPESVRVSVTRAG